jgi:hypothetical protein
MACKTVPFAALAVHRVAPLTSLRIPVAVRVHVMFVLVQTACERSRE